MDLNTLIMDSIKLVIAEDNPTSVKFTDKKEQGIKDQNISGKAQADLEGGLKEKTADENVNPQGEGGEDAVTTLQKNPKLVSTVVAGIIAGSKITPNKDVKFTPPAPATNEKGEDNK